MNKAYKNTIKVYDKLGKKYIRDSVNLVPVERPLFIKTIPKGAKILDVGCGGGRDSLAFSNFGFDVVGVDLSEVMLKEARRFAPAAKFIKMDTLKLDFPKNSFDAIWAQAVLLHLKRDDVPKVLKKFYNILKPGGLVHVRVKQGRGEDLVKEELSGWQERFYTYFSKTEMEGMLRNAKFKVVYSKLFPDELGRNNIRWIAVWGKKA